MGILQPDQMNIVVFFWYLLKVICPVYAIVYTRTLETIKMYILGQNFRHPVDLKRGLFRYLSLSE